MLSPGRRDSRPKVRLTAFCFTVQNLLDIAKPLPTALAAAISLGWRNLAAGGPK